jgi:ApaG protein
MYKAVTQDIAVTVEPRFVEEESEPRENRYFFAYTVEIANRGARQVTLRSRYWKIIDGQGRMQEVRGAGVVGKQPVLGPGESFTYTSGCPLETPNGTMQGAYTSGCPLTTPDGSMEGAYVMEAPDGETFQVRIPPFALESPHAAARVVH